MISRFRASITNPKRVYGCSLARRLERDLTERSFHFDWTTACQSAVALDGCSTKTLLSFIKESSQYPLLLNFIVGNLLFCSRNHRVVHDACVRVNGPLFVLPLAFSDHQHSPGDQHHGNVANPFEEIRPRMSEYTAQQIATLQSRLEKQLGPEYISSRAGPSGQRVHYVAAEKCIALANDIFGFNGWSSSIQNITVDFVDEHPQTMRVSLGLSVIVRVSLRDGTYHEDLGYGHIENCKGKAAAFEKAKKEGTTDALKRALRNFGNVLGNCIYDKEYLSKVTKIKAPPTKFSEANLHRHQDFVKKEVKEEVKQEREVKPISAPKEEPRAVGDIELFSDDFGGTYYCLEPLPAGITDKWANLSRPG